MEMNSLVIPTSSLGYLSYDVLSYVMIVGEDGIAYYAEAHLSPLNAWIHTIVMPFSMYGMLIWISAFFNLNPYNAEKLIWALYCFYGGHYYRVNKLGALFYYGIYYYSVRKAIVDYTDNYIPISRCKEHQQFNQVHLLMKGLLISFFGLLIQEIFGHKMGGDIASRPEGILNAIVYAMYFSSNHYLYE